MSMGIYPVFEPNLTGDKFDALGEALAANFEALDKIAVAAKLTPFTVFSDSREIPEDFDGDPDELAELMGECTEWFDPGEGRAAIQSLIDHIKSNPKAAKRLDEPQGVVQELEDLRAHSQLPSRRMFSSAWR
jgi:hypothetical protein